MRPLDSRLAFLTRLYDSQYWLFVHVCATSARQFTFLVAEHAKQYQLRHWWTHGAQLRIACRCAEVVTVCDVAQLRQHGGGVPGGQSDHGHVPHAAPHLVLPAAEPGRDDAAAGGLQLLALVAPRHSQKC